MRPLTQDPHGSSAFSDRVLESAIGRQVRAFRHHKGLTVAQLSAEANLSPGMLSKIENGATSPSLTSLLSLSRALSVPMTALFRGFEEERAVCHVKAGDGAEAERAGTRAGHQYSLLGHLPSTSAGVVVEPYLITLSTEADVFPTFQHDGMEFLYMLAGVVDYRHGTKIFRLEPGDSLFFDADAPHGPEGLIDLPARYLSIICYPQ
ncbi:helix-turn-helix domain-containing protein [Pseudaestuariivita atlantica]|nr:XRE family transcriptional regulator [Pseudaestuariivita atlantica]